MSPRLFLALIPVVLLIGCETGSSPPADKSGDRAGESAEQGPAGTHSEETGSARAGTDDLPLPKGENLTEKIKTVNQEVPVKNADFEPGSAEPLEFDKGKITRTETGFVIDLPTSSPVPTPTITDGRLFVSGGFSTEEYYSFDAVSGDFLWGAKLDDDGPSSAVPYEDSIIFGCESCTLFALDAKTGKHKWSHYLGDPLLSIPTVADGRVFTVYPDGSTGGFGEPIEQPEQAEKPKAEPVREGVTHVAICCDAGTGRVIWQRRIDSDCMTAPVAVGEDLYLVTLSGTLYRFGQADGTIRSSERLRLTSAPAVVENQMFVTRRTDDPRKKNSQISEGIVAQGRTTGTVQYLAAQCPAPYLDREIQAASGFSEAAGGFESSNGIMGGFGGGFGGGQPSISDDPKSDDPEQAPGETEPCQSPPVDEQNSSEPVAQFGSSPAGGFSQEAEPAGDLLSQTQQMAADTIGQGNVSTLQSFQGSRILYRRGRLFNCMGRQLVCTLANTGKVVWRKDLEGDLEKLGGHLATPPVAAGAYLFTVTVSGEVLQLDPENGDEIKRYPVGSEVRFPPAIDKGRIYVGTQDGKVVCIDTGDSSITGWPMWGGDAAHNRVVR